MEGIKGDLCRFKNKEKLGKKRENNTFFSYPVIIHTVSIVSMMSCHVCVIGVVVGRVVL